MDDEPYSVGHDHRGWYVIRSERMLGPFPPTQDKELAEDLARALNDGHLKRKNRERKHKRQRKNP